MNIHPSLLPLSTEFIPAYQVAPPPAWELEMSKKFWLTVPDALVNVWGDIMETSRMSNPKPLPVPPVLTTPDAIE